MTNIPFKPFPEVKFSDRVETERSKQTTDVLKWLETFGTPAAKREPKATTMKEFDTFIKGFKPATNLPGTRTAGNEKIESTPKQTRQEYL